MIVKIQFFKHLKKDDIIIGGIKELFAHPNKNNRVIMINNLERYFIFDGIETIKVVENVNNL